MPVFKNRADPAREKSKFLLVYQRYKDLMYYVAFQILHSREDAEEAVNDALWQVAQNIEKINEIDCPKTKRFVVIITERKAIDLYRKNQRRGVLPLEAWAADAAPDPDAALTVSAAIGRLPPDQREVILLRYADGYSVREIAQMLGYTVSKVEKQISRGKKRLEELLREEGMEL